jgi:molybdenum-dependent DNA-binding transcriptional regulator ModE
MKTAVLITVTSGEIDKNKELFGFEAIGKVFDMTPVEWLTKSAFTAGVNRAVVCGTDEMMPLIKVNCKKLFAEFVMNTKHDSRYMVHGLKYVQSKVERVAIVSSDYPFTNPGTFRLLLESDAPVAVAVCGGVRSEVLAVNTDLLDDVIAEGGDLTPLFGQAVEIECGDKGAISAVSQPGTNLQSLFDNCELRNRLRPINRNCIGLEDSFFGPGTIQTFRLIGEQHSINKGKDIMGMGYATFVIMRDRIEDALGFEFLRDLGDSKQTPNVVLTPQAIEFMERYERYIEALEASNKKIFDEFFGDYVLKTKKKKKRRAKK